MAPGSRGRCRGNRRERRSAGMTSLRCWRRQVCSWWSRSAPSIACGRCQPKPGSQQDLDPENGVDCHPPSRLARCAGEGQVGKIGVSARSGIAMSASLITRQGGLNRALISAPSPRASSPCASRLGAIITATRSAARNGARCRRPTPGTHRASCALGAGEATARNQRKRDRPPSRGAQTSCVASNGRPRSSSSSLGSGTARMVA